MLRVYVSPRADLGATSACPRCIFQCNWLQYDNKHRRQFLIPPVVQQFLSRPECSFVYATPCAQISTSVFYLQSLFPQTLTVAMSRENRAFDTSKFGTGYGFESHPVLGVEMPPTWVLFVGLGFLLFALAFWVYRYHCL